MVLSLFKHKLIDYKELFKYYVSMFLSQNYDRREGKYSYIRTNISERYLKPLCITTILFYEIAIFFFWNILQKTIF